MVKDEAYREAEQRIEKAQEEGAVKLDLSIMGLTEVPEAIASLSGLQQLYLSRNKLTALPEAIASLTGLQRLNLSSNKLTKLPEAIASLTQLQDLNLTYRTHLISFQAVSATASRLSISRIKHSLSLALERSSVRSKFLTKLLHLSTQAFDLSMTHLAATGTNPDSPFVCFCAFDGLAESSN
ncbi:hypothetical protein NSMS1_49460 [Nostoc sp. MS1]|nr:hypothetical protein NSMS1_49460 [Nostoc sp. MS1]